MAIYWLQRSVELEDRRWGRHMLGPAAVDTILVIAIGVVAAAVDFVTED
jgi:hypothetical protein